MENVKLSLSLSSTHAIACAASTVVVTVAVVAVVVVGLGPYAKFAATHSVIHSLIRYLAVTIVESEVHAILYRA